MTTIIIRKDNKNEYRGFICMGHAGYARKRWFGKSQDILCSAISMMVISTVNSLEDLADERLAVTANEETGFIRCDFESVLQEKSVFLVDSMVYSLQNLSKEYGEQYLQVKFEEV